MLFVHKKSNYKSLPQFECWDEERDAFNYTGHAPIIAHPPCRLWSRLRAFTTAPDEERFLGIAAIDYVRMYGGVVEHPYDSGLFKKMGVPKPGFVDEYGGIFLVVDQFHFGYYIRKRTGLYIVGCSYADIPAQPLRMELVTRRFENLTKKQRSETTLDFALFLYEIWKKINSNYGEKKKL